MAASRLSFITCITFLSLLFLFSRALNDGRQQERDKRDVLDSTEIPAEHIDPAAIDLTPLVNTLINTSQSGSRQLFSLLSVTSYSSLALHKLTLLVYNISSISSIENSVFRRRFCYCVTNETNDLTDFTAVLLDVMGNSTSYLHELFKSASILSVSQRNNSECIYICVMAGREVSELWKVDSITPLFNQTIVEGPHRVGNVSSIRLPLEWNQVPTNLSHVPQSGISSMLTSRVHSTAHVSSTTPDEATTTTRQPTTTAVMSQSQTTVVSAWEETTQAAMTRPTTDTQTTTVLQPVMTTQPTTTMRLSTAPVTTTTPPTVVTTPATTASTSTTGTTVTTTLTTTEATPTTIATTTMPTTTTTTTTTPTPIATTTTTIATTPTTVATTSTTIPTTPTAVATTTATIATATMTTTTTPTTTTTTPTTLGTTTGTTQEPTIPTTSPTTAGTTRPSTLPPVISFTTPSTLHRPSSTFPVHPTRLSPVRPTARPTPTRKTTRPLSRKTTTPSRTTDMEKPGCPWRRPELNHVPVSVSVSVSGGTTTVSAHKLQPCVLELCKFFSQCLCKPFSHKNRMKRFCADSHLWYEQHTTEVCRRSRRLSFSRNLKQRCLTKMCNKL